MSDEKPMTPRRPKMPPAEAGFALIEVLVSAIVILVVSAGTFGLLQAMTRASGEQRHRAQAYAIAQEDQARLRSMQLIALNHLDESRQVTLGGTAYTVRSTGLFINNTTSAVSCTGENTSADYARVTTAITWPGMEDEEKTVLKSIVSPSNSSIDSNNGTLTVSVTNEKGEPKSGVDLEVGIYSDTTNVDGCATFPNLAQGTHTVEADGEDANLVGTNSNYEESKPGGVGAGSAKVTKLIYDTPGTVPVKFKYRVGSTEKFEPSPADSIVAFHSVMKAAKVFGTPGGTRSPELAATLLFPFTSSYSIYAGSCEFNKPSPGLALGSAVVPAGGITGTLELQLPALDLTVKKGGSVVQGATVTITDRDCEDSKGSSIKRVYTTNKDGKLSATSTGKAEPGLPWGEYDLCASATISETSYRRKSSEVAVKSLTGAKSVTLELTETGKSPCS
jgi:Tfp pilus assembly protein PilV